MAFESLSDKLQNVFKNLRGKGRLSEADVKTALKEVKMALLEADVSFKVVKQFISSVQERAVGQDPHQPDDQTLDDDIQDLLAQRGQLADQGVDHQVLVLPGGDNSAQVDQINKADPGDLLTPGEADPELAQDDVHEGEEDHCAQENSDQDLNAAEELVYRRADPVRFATAVGHRETSSFRVRPRPRRGHGLWG